MFSRQLARSTTYVLLIFFLFVWLGLGLSLKCSSSWRNFFFCSFFFFTLWLTLDDHTYLFGFRKNYCPDLLPVLFISGLDLYTQLHSEVPVVPQLKCPIWDWPSSFPSLPFLCFFPSYEKATSIQPAFPPRNMRLILTSVLSICLHHLILGLADGLSWIALKYLHLSPLPHFYSN